MLRFNFRIALILDVSVSDMNDDDTGNGERAGSSKSNSITSEQSGVISASSQVWFIVHVDVMLFRGASKFN